MNENNIDFFEEFRLAVLNVSNLCKKYNVNSFIDIYHVNKGKNKSCTNVDFEIPIKDEC